MNAELRDLGDRHEWDVFDLQVTQLIAEPAGLRVVGWHLDGSIEIRVGHLFTYALADGSETRIDPEQSEQLAPLLSLVNQSIMGITVFKSGTLFLRFGDGSALRCEPHNQFEAWEASGVGVLEEVAYLCGPGGGSPWRAA